MTKCSFSGLLKYAVQIAKNICHNNFARVHVQQSLMLSTRSLSDRLCLFLPWKTQVLYKCLFEYMYLVLCVMGGYHNVLLHKTASYLILDKFLAHLNGLISWHTSLLKEQINKGKNAFACVTGHFTLLSYSITVF